MPVTLEQRKSFVDRARQTPSAQVAHVHTEYPTNLVGTPLTYHRPEAPGPTAQEQPPPSPPSFLSPFETEDLHGHDEMYEDLEEAEAAIVPVSTVHVQLDVSKGGRILVPTVFKLAGGVTIPATILVDTGSMANFINKGFIRKHDLKTRQRKHPIRCVGFDGRKGVGGLVTQDWAGSIQLSSIDSKPVPLSASFGITRLGSVDAIFGLPWLDRQGWIASGSKKGGHHFTLGSTPLYVIESSAMGGQPEDKLCPPPS
ncbi:hypothetical protein PCANC_15728 [Puccinia coronata f. sp. avenae]|uniref:Uncharacterized protein n=1 Tax=Puccinia coronata f. sp. avenae TaxID=200324 RepID=A0A2N5SW95_9BASI|nr:hypothetical protein PCANC_15728 [Puccinia coronata f. sp. avenae]PLW17501.1 hypothetical protein PCASD_16716 [Puccinia coronata f. sp. avenae]